MMERAATGELRWSLTMYPTAAYAQDADMATDECGCRSPGCACSIRPIRSPGWNELHDRQQQPDRLA